MTERKFDQFDEYADNYREIHTENIRISGADSYYFAEMKVRLMMEFEKKPTLKILDVGCGDGATETFFEKYFPRWQVRGIDISAESIRQAKNRSLSTAEFTEYDGINMPFDAGSFDIVFMAGVLHHVDFSLHALILKEINRVLKTGGRFYLFEHNPINPLTRYLVKNCIFDKNAKLLKKNYVHSVLKQQSFKIQHAAYIVFFPRNSFFQRLHFLEKYLTWLPLGGQYYCISLKANQY